MSLEIQKDTVGNIACASELLRSVVAIPIKVNEYDKDTQAPHEVHDLRKTPQIVFVLHRRMDFAQR